MIYGENYYYNRNKRINLIKNDLFYSFKSNNSINEIKKRVKECKLDIVNILSATDKSHFFIKRSRNLSLSKLENCLKSYSVESYQNYYVNNPANSVDSWPIVPSNKIVISFKSETTKSQIKNVIKRYNLKLIKESKLIDLFYIFDTDPNRAIEVANKIYESGIAKYSEPDFYIPYYKKFIPNDQYFPDQWHLADGVGGVNIKNAWDITKGSSDIKIAIVDDGIDLNHEDLNIISHRNFTNESYELGGNHGTACAGVASGRGDNEIGITGSCINCSIISAKIMLENENYGYTTSTPSGEAIEWASDSGASVISNSWGYKVYIPVPIYLYNSINYATSNGRGGKGAVVLFAAGNENRDLQSDELEAHPNILTIAASTSEDTRASYSNFGNYLAITAPSSGGLKRIVTSDAYKDSDGVDIRGYNRNGTYIYGGADIDSIGKYTKTFGGTSSATPLVSGIVGLILSLDSTLTFLEVRELLIRNTTKIGDLSSYNLDGYSTLYGYGKVDAYKVIKATQRGLGCIPTAAREICDNNIDDDCDHKIDDNDRDCLPGNNCQSYIETISANGEYVGDTSTSLYEDSFLAPTSCIDSSNSKDMVYRIYLDAPKRVTFELKDATFDSVIYLKSSCSDRDVLYCNDEKNQDSHLSKISEDLEAGVYFLIIDGFSNSNSGTFVLDVTFENLPNPCAGIDCSNHGICKVVDDSAKCLCDNGYYLESDSCLPLSKKCENFNCENGICLIDLDEETPFCECNDNYVLRNNRCIIVDRCKDVSCSENMKCNPVTGNCICEDGFHTYNDSCISDTSCLDIKCSTNQKCKDGKCTPISKNDDSCNYTQKSNQALFFLFFFLFMISLFRKFLIYNKNS